MRTTPSRSGRDLALVALLALVVSLLSLLVRRPVILPDEAGFLLTARQIGQGAPPSGLNYHPGYSFLLAPFTVISDDLGTLTRFVQLVNAVLSVGVAILTLVLARRIAPDLDRRHAIAVVAIVLLYPAHVVFGALALSENLFVVVVLGWAVLATHLRPGAPTGVIAAFGLVGGLAHLIHARAVAVVLATLVAIAWSQRRHPRALVLGLAVTLVAFAAAFATVESVLSFSGVAEVDSEARDTLSGIVRANLGAVALATLPFTALGQLLYLTVATIGLLGPALATAWRRLGRQFEPLDHLALPLVVLFVATLGISALFLNEQSGDQAIYGRYLEAVVAPLLVVGSVVVLRDVARRRLLVPVAALVPATALLLVAIRGAGTFDGRQQLLNISAITPVVEFDGAIRLSSIALVGLVAILGFRQLLDRSPAGAVALVLVLFAGAGVTTLVRLADSAEVLAERADLVPTIAAAADDLGVGCVALDQQDLDERWFQENYRLVLPDLEFRHWDGVGAPCSPLVVSPRPDLGIAARVVDVEPRGNQLLWVLDSSPLPIGLDGVAAPTAPLPADQFALLDIRLDPPFVVGPGQRITGTVTVENAGPATFFPEGALPSSDGAINVGLEWRDLQRSDTRLHEPFRLRLDDWVRPGSSLEIPFELRTTRPDGRLEPGRYVLHVEVVQEGVRWTGLTDQLVVEVRSDGAAEEP